MYKNIKSKEEGFTIIEVVLVLAIAALIFLIVFLALPQLQRSRRDTQRKSDAGRVLSAMESYASDHNGDYAPAFANLDNNLRDEYITAGGDQFADPASGTAYTLANATGIPGNFTTINVAQNSVCFGTPTGNRNVAVRIDLESGEYCQDNQ